LSVVENGAVFKFIRATVALPLVPT